MGFVQQFKKYISENRNQLFFIMFVLIVAYGYFITNWSISKDSEIETYRGPNYDNRWLLMTGRFVLYVLDLLHNNNILPFWNDFLAVGLIFLSSIIWVMTLSLIKQGKRGELMFGLIYCISPIYVFYLRFTTYEISISIGMVLMSLAAYYFTLALIKIEAKLPYKLNLLLTLFYVYLAIGTYRMFACYWLTSFFLIANFRALSDLSCNKPYVISCVRTLTMGLAILLVGLGLYTITSLIIYHYVVPESSYAHDLISWGKLEPHIVLQNLKVYVLNLLFHFRFNFFMLLTAGSVLLFTTIILYHGIRNLFFIIPFYIFLVSPLFLSFVTGTAMVLRTIQNLPLVLAASWLFMYSFYTSNIVKKMMLGITILATFFNAQYIVRLFYSDHMRLQQDINYTYQLYNFLLTNVGSSLYVKPLVMVGIHPSPNEPYKISIPNDTISASFFEYDSPNVRKDRFMKWLGMQHVSPTPEQVNLAYNYINDMGNFPEKSSVKETHDLIILKLSNSDGYPAQKSLFIDSATFAKVASDAIRSYVDSLNVLSDRIQTSGWAYFLNETAVYTSIFIKFKSENNEYIYPTTLVSRPEIAAWLHDGKNLDLTGFAADINKQDIQPGTYKVYLMLTNKKNIGEIDTNKTIVI